MAQEASGAGRRLRAWYREQLGRERRLRLLLWVCAVAFGAGGWFLLRGVAALAVAGPQLPLPYGESLLLAGYSALLGVALLYAAAGLSMLRPWAWMALALCTLLVVGLAALASLTMGIVDWAGLFAALALVLTVAHPAVRELFLQTEPERAAAARNA